ncbi:MAG: hypothetical protein WCT52_01335 [Candidatus Micrarchaeia archaeon]
MSHTCDRCRTSYDSGAFYGGHDYCNTCYVKIQEEERKKREDDRRKTEEARKERERQFVKDREKHDMYKQMEEEKRHRELEADKQHEREVQQKILEQQKHLLEERSVAKQKHHWDITIARPGEVKAVVAPPDPMQIKTPMKTKPVKFQSTDMPGRRYKLDMTGVKPAPKKRERAKAISSVGLSVKKGLPVSLSVGQKEVKTLFMAKNSSPTKLTLEFAITIEDSKKKQIEPKLEPKQCAIEPDAEMELTAQFDLKDDAPTGPLTMTAQLRENAIYVDRESAKSEAIALSAQVKTAMELEYIPGSAEFEKQDNGTLALILVFQNTGETGGFLVTRSSVGYGVENRMKRSNLAAKTKIKGKQKKVRLVFSPSEETAIKFLTFDFSGTDANGKEYKFQNSLDVKSGKLKKEKKGKKEAGEAPEGDVGKETGG